VRDGDRGTWEKKSSSTGEVSSGGRHKGCGILCSGRCSPEPGIGPVAPMVDAVIDRSSADAIVDGVGAPSSVSSRTDSTEGGDRGTVEPARFDGT
jgi:hypothetical protein